MTEIDTRGDAESMTEHLDLMTIVGAARAAQRPWASTPAAGRAAALRAGATALREHADELAATLQAETGRPAASGREGVLAGAGTLDQYAELGPVHRGRTLQGNWDATDFMIRSRAAWWPR